MKFCKTCVHFDLKSDNCHHPDYSPITDVVSGMRGHVPAEVCRHLPQLCGTHAWKHEERITIGSVEDWEAA
jgi:hypothetical protein